MISLIAAMDKNRVIGKDNKLPWRLPADLAYFKKTTMGHTVIMGRKTYQSIGKPLPGRKNLIITRNTEYKPGGCLICHSIEEALEYGICEEVFVAGGDEIYSGIFPFAGRLYITYINHSFEGDTYFPIIDDKVWNLVSKEKGPEDEKNPYDYYFMIYEKTK